ncbi:uncharacterized protein LOC124268761 [Haliotis rubra]|uniref:uncharacterized protein LOC124268761 n=1 Tax=Haliotis rubra TaxID=36100 RepID=UPI001EE55841|nr:uncharacterized protein LOC124268761 [Haliotis rubra]
MTDTRSVVEYFIVVMCLQLNFIGVDCLCFECNDYRLSDFEGKAVTDFQLATFLHVEMAGFCTQRCLQDHRCRSYRYNTRTKTCSTYGCGFSLPSKTLNPVTEEGGSRLYAFCGRGPSFGMKCVTSSNCAFGNSACADGVCVCVTGTSYDVTTGNCLIRCTIYGSESSTYPESGIDGCNINALTTSTMQACIAACKGEIGFGCITAEFYHDDGTCYLCDTPALELPEGYVSSGTDHGWSLAVRHCAQ